jgi:hypothetical protein
MNTAGAAAAVLLAYLVAIVREAEYSEFHCEPSTLRVIMKLTYE